MWNRKIVSWTAVSVAFLVSVISCGSKSGGGEANVEEKRPKSEVQVPAFNADSAYQFVQAQADFGPRVPNTAAHRACGDYLAAQLERFGAQVYNQQADLMAFDNTLLKARNIIGAYNPDSRKRVMLCAHWDSRPFADYDEDPAKQRKPILGVNDGASGVGVLLEVARQLQQQAPAIGIDILFFDAEDYGTPAFHKGEYKENTWCLGSQYWGRVPHVSNYNARYGILLDMVGGKGATFYQELFSKRTAGKQMKKIWDAAHQLGFGQYFPKRDGTEVTDDHVYVYQLQKIPCVDIINYDPEGDTGFGDFWHTSGDTMEVIDRATLQAVGQTLLYVIYHEE